ncbi:putative MFS family arabinose efflux permease [Brevundimonas sp. 1080]|uniref:MFS transporter n=1 Tax=Brevundimonas sp. 1080 TaxID=3156405 RepID=UPI00339AFF8D
MSAASAEIVRGPRAWALLVVLTLVSIFSQIDRILPYILAESIRTELGLSDTEIGLITGLAFAVCYTLFSLPLARAADRGSPRLVLLACLLVWSLMTGLGGLAGSFVVLAMTRLGVAFGEAGGTPSAHALIARRIGPDRRGLAIGLLAMGIPLGTMIGFIGGGLIDEAFGWRAAFIGAGALGVTVALLVWLTAGPTPPLRRPAEQTEPYVRSALRLLSVPAFRWLMVGALAVGFATAPFYTFTAPFLIRTHGLTTAQVGLSFGLLQGLTGVIGALVGGRMFDRGVRRGARHPLLAPAAMLVMGALSTTAALFASAGWMAIALFVPAMLGFAFLLPWVFGAGHRIAGPGKEALASSLGLVASGLFGPALAPVLVGLISDNAAGVGLANGLALGLLIGPACSVLTALALMAAGRRMGLA